MSDLGTLKKIIPADQALANKALAQSLQQVKRIFDTNVPDLAPRLATLQTTNDLPLIAGLDQPIPDSVTAFWANTFATGTGPGDTVTTDDVIGIAAGNTVTTAMPVVISGLVELTDLGALVPLTANGGSSGSVNNGIYALMSYALAGDYSLAGNVADSTTIPNTVYYAGPQTFADVNDAFANTTVGLIARANAVINTVISSYANVTTSINNSYHAVADQLAINVTNCVLADIDIANVAFDIANANLVSNATSTSLNFVASLHEYGTEDAPGGTADFLTRVANLDTLAGQAVVASLREGRNIQKLNEIGILLDTQIPSVPVVGNIG
jgi:hypothetical protein